VNPSQVFALPASSPAAHSLVSQPYVRTRGKSTLKTLNTAEQQTLHTALTASPLAKQLHRRLLNLDVRKKTLDGLSEIGDYHVKNPKAYDHLK
jgi:hypothetical protein